MTPDNVNRVINFAVLEQADAVNSIAFSPNGTMLAVGSGSGWGEPGSVRLWDVATGTERAVFQGYADWVQSVAFSPDGRLLASGSGDGTVRLWDTATEAPVLMLAGLSDAVSGTITFTDDDGTVTNQKVFSDAVWSVAFSPDGASLATGRGDPWVGPGSFQVYDTATGELLTDIRPEAASDSAFPLSVYSLAFSPGGRLLVIVNGRLEVQLWDMATGEKRADLSADTNWAGLEAAFSPDGSLVAASGVRSDCSGWGEVCSPEDERGETRLWDVATGEQVALLAGHTGGDHSVTFSPDGKILASAGGWEDGSVRLWDVATGKSLAVLDTPSVSSLAFSPDGTILATGSLDGTIRLWGLPAQ
jgi:WD40 repeat protein